MCAAGTACKGDVDRISTCAVAGCFGRDRSIVASGADNIMPQHAIRAEKS
jgi:hypothetical protein